MLRTTRLVDMAKLLLALPDVGLERATVVYVEKPLK